MENITPLCVIAYKYGTDKCPQVRHHYTPIYYKLLKDKIKTTKKVVELGIGHRSNIDWVPEHYQNGASLLMWREFFPNAHIYGLDFDPTTMMQTDRIDTMLVDERKARHLRSAIEKIGVDIDLFIDDGIHRESSQVRTAKILLPLFHNNVVYVIEDVKRPEEVKKQLSDYNCEVIKSTHPVKTKEEKRHDHLVIVRKAQ